MCKTEELGPANRVPIEAYMTGADFVPSWPDGSPVLYDEKGNLIPPEQFDDSADSYAAPGYQNRGSDVVDNS